MTQPKMVSDSTIQQRYAQLTAAPAHVWAQHATDGRWTTQALRTIRTAAQAELRSMIGKRALSVEDFRRKVSSHCPVYVDEVINRLIDAGFVTERDGMVRTHPGLPERSWDAADAERRRVAEKKEAAAAAKAAARAERTRERGLRHYLLEAAKSSTGVVSTPTGEPYMQELIAAGLLTLDGTLHTYTNPVTDADLSPEELRRARTVTANHLRALMGEQPLSGDTDPDLAMSRLRGILVDDDGALIESGSVIDALAVVTDDHRQRQEEAARREAARQAAAKAEAERQAEEERARQEEAARREAARLERAAAARATAARAERMAVAEAQAASAEQLAETPSETSETTFTAEQLRAIARDARTSVRMLDLIGKAVYRAERQADTLQQRMIRDADPDVRITLATMCAKLRLSGGAHHTLSRHALKDSLANRKRADGSPPVRAFFKMAMELGVESGVLRMTTEGNVELADYSLIMTDEQFDKRCATMTRRQQTSERSWAKKLVSA